MIAQTAKVATVAKSAKSAANANYAIIAKTAKSAKSVKSVKDARTAQVLIPEGRGFLSTKFLTGLPQAGSCFIANLFAPQADTASPAAKIFTAAL